MKLKTRQKLVSYIISCLEYLPDKKIKDIAFSAKEEVRQKRGESFD